MGKVETNKKQKNTTLLQTSFELFTEKGFTKTTISDIVNRAGLAKGTFYLYFKDKYDLRDRLVTYKTSQLFGNAHTALIEQNIQGFENQMFFVIDHIIDRLEKEPKLLQFISKNLSWGIFKNAFEKTVPENSRQFYDYYQDMLTQNHISCENQELMLFTILELVGSTCYSCILYQQPVSIADILPHKPGNKLRHIGFGFDWLFPRAIMQCEVLRHLLRVAHADHRHRRQFRSGRKHRKVAACP